MPKSKKGPRASRRRVALSQLEQQLERGVNYKNVDLTSADRKRIQTEISNLKKHLKINETVTPTGRDDQAGTT
jgi:hypothetical protein